VPNYTYPRSDTVKNAFGIVDYDELERIEAAIVKARHTEIVAGAGPQGQFDAEHIKALHRHLFQDVYEWAGRTRDERVSLSDGTIASEPILQKVEGQPFVIGPIIPAALDDLGEELRAANYLRDLPREVFAERAADIMAELNSVHPFREGNGRTQRVFVEQLAHAAGHDLDFTVISKERMIHASIAAHERGDTSMMRRMFDEISDPTRVAVLRVSVASLEKWGVPWNDHYVATLAPGHAVNLVFAGVAGEQFMARTQTAILFGKVADLPQPCPERGQALTVTPAPARLREQRREQRISSSSPTLTTPTTPASEFARANAPPEKQAEQQAAREKLTRDFAGDKFSRELDDNGRSRDRDPGRGPGRTGGGGGRGGRGRG
jgi:cell filamentation protein